MTSSNLLRINSWEDLNGEVLKIKTDKLLVVIDKTIAETYKKELAPLLKKSFVFEVVASEKNKSLETFELICEFFLEKNIHRDSHLVAIGGGALSDLAGFAASSLLRGISWSIIPTTLLSLVDASIGGKVGVNSNLGKNLIGAFHAPENIFQFFGFLESLPSKESHSGKGEILKYAFLSPEVFNLVEENRPLEEIISACALFKKEIVEEDQKECGKRRILNFGHTFGHAFERKYFLPHGIAVAMGIRETLKNFGASKELLRKFGQLSKMLELELSEEMELSCTEIRKYVFKDKKRVDSKSLRLVICDDIGKTREVILLEKDLLDLYEF
jgi:3-dehydroquinate synthetase